MIDESTSRSPVGGSGAGIADCAIPNFGHDSFDFQRRPNNLHLNPAGNMTESEHKHPAVSNNPSNDLNVNLLPVLTRFNGVNDSSASSTNESQRSGDSDAASSHCNSGSPAPQLARSFSQSNSENADTDAQTNQRLGCDPDIQEKIDLLEREKKVLQYHNQFLKEELESHKKQICELNKTVTELRKRNARYQDILTSYEQLTAVGFKNKQEPFFNNQVSSATSEDENLSEKALTPTSSPSTESESTKGGISFPVAAPPPVSNPSTPSVPGINMFQMGSQPNTPVSSNPNLLLELPGTGDRMMSNRKLSAPQNPRDNEARSPPLLLGSDFKPPSFAYSTTERSVPPERERPTHIRQRSLQYCIPASPLVGKPLPSSGQVRPSSPAIGEGPTSIVDNGVTGQNNYTNGNHLAEPFRNGHPTGNARLNSLRSANAQSKMGSMGRTSSCSERKVAPGPPPRSSGLSKIENKTDKSCSVPNLNVYGLDQGFNRPGSAVTGHGENMPPSTPKRNNSIIRLFSRKNGANNPNNNQKGGQEFSTNQSNGSSNPNHPPNLLIPRDNDEPTSFSQGNTPILGSNGHKRLTHQSSLQDFNENTPFRSWDRKQLSVWLDKLSLGQYISCLPSSINGAALVDAGPHHFEKILGMKNHLHRKKLILAIRSKLSSRPNPVDHIDHSWVIRWLDDIGLPQHKESFAESKIDGRVLYYLTFDDLVSLKVFSALHQISIGRAVQCLRTQQWNPTCLIRRPFSGPPQTTSSSQSPVPFSPPELGPPGEDQRSRKGSTDAGSIQSEDGPEDLLLWTNHRIMDWLRSIDLSEYAPNLRGSGVHGALMCLEPRFLGETLADVLCIPNSKTLLRRHLVSHFNQLVGRHCHELKRMIEVSGHYQPLSPSVRVKCTRRTRRRSRDRGGDLNDLVCPLAFEVPNFVPQSVLPSGYFIRSEDFTNIPISPSLFLEPSSPARRMNPLQRQSSAGSLEELVACGVYPGDDAFTAESVQDISMLSNQIQSLTTQLSEDPEK